MRPVIVALDFENQQVVTDFLDQFSESEPVMVKVGMELFYEAGPSILRTLRERGLQIFLI